jgi:hypothetical protein
VPGGVRAFQEITARSKGWGRSMVLTTLPTRARALFCGAAPANPTAWPFLRRVLCWRTARLRSAWAVEGASGTAAAIAGAAATVRAAKRLARTGGMVLSIAAFTLEAV